MSSLVLYHLLKHIMKALISSKSRISAGIALLFAVFSISNSCTKDDMSDMNGNGGDNGGSKGPGTNEVFIQDMTFTPGTITVATNTTIKWTNKDAVTHNVTSDSGLFDSGNIAGGGTWSYTFASAGTYPYHCTPHPVMTATMVVN
jgi:plastocyanin